MPRIVRPMKKDSTDPLKPRVGPRFCCLGIRPNEVDLDHSGCVVQNRKGMSVSADWRGLQPELIPIELDDGKNGARGKNMEVFVHGNGSGPFGEGAIAAGLMMCFKAGTTTAGEVCPVASVPLAQYECDLVATQSGWEIDPS